MGPGVAVAEVRGAVRACLADLTAGDLVLVACSGGADSLALAAAAAFVAPRLGLRAGGVTVDHGLQPGSAERAGDIAAQMARLGLDPVQSVAVTVPPPALAAGPEAAARTARYAALDEAAAAHGAVAVLLGHTLDDQAETVLLGLARGSGGRSLAGMPARRGRFRRPLLGLSRATLREACLAQRLDPWDDPHNGDPSYARVRVRREALPALEQALGPGIAEALARSAAQLRADCDALDDIARGEAWRIQPPVPPGPGPAAQPGPGPAAQPGDGAVTTILSVADIDGLAALAPAIRTRVLRQAALLAGCPGGSLTAAHVAALDALVTGWHGQHGADLPGAIRAQRRYGRLLFSAGRLAAGRPVRVGSPERTEAEASGGRE